MLKISLAIHLQKGIFVYQPFSIAFYDN